MCNANNHPPGCMCGWGGDGHSGISSGGGGLQKFSDPFKFEFDQFNSYVNPNAICPVCGAQVFFYKSPSGGRVFFDELGPPWPKHPCTDNSKYRNFKPEYLNAYLSRSVTPKWVMDGWHPAIAVAIGNEKSQYYVHLYIVGLGGYFKSVKTYIYSSFIDKLRKEGNLLYYKYLEGSDFELYIYNPDTEFYDSIVLKLNN